MEFAVRSVNGEAECGGFFGGLAKGLMSMSPKSEGTGQRQGGAGGDPKKSQTCYRKVSCKGFAESVGCRTRSGWG